MPSKMATSLARWRTHSAQTQILVLKIKMKKRVSEEGVVLMYNLIGQPLLG